MAKRQKKRWTRGIVRPDPLEEFEWLLEVDVVSLEKTLEAFARLEQMTENALLRI